MPEVDIIIRARPSDPNFLKQTDYPLGFFEKFAQALNIQMQFEPTADCILTFLKTLADFEKIFQVLGENAVKNYSNYVPSEDSSSWEFSVVKFSHGENRTLLQELSNGFQSFLGEFGRVKMQGEKVLVDMPLNLHFERHFYTADSTYKQSKLPHKSAIK